MLHARSMYYTLHGSIILMICVQIYTAMEPRLDIERVCLLEETYIACVRVNVPPLTKLV